MFIHYVQLGFYSLRRNPVLTLLMVMSIGLGVAASMTTWSVFRVVSGNPLPDKSSQLFVPQLDNWGPNDIVKNGQPPNAVTYRDAMAFMQAHEAERQTALYPVRYAVTPERTGAEPFRVQGHAVFADFFPMFELPFRFGAGWSRADDDAHAGAVVISRQLNDRVFGGANSVGRSIHLGDHDFRITGVLDNWNPQPRFYDVSNHSAFGDQPDIFVPFNRAIDLHTQTNGNNACHENSAPGFEGWLHSECVWIAFWAELPDAAAQSRFRSFLEGYGAKQQQSGRFNWPPQAQMHNLQDWLDYTRVVPSETPVSLAVSAGFLLVCLVNAVGLMLAKFMRRAPEIGVRRALGATRQAIYAQFLAEATMVGLAGGLVGLAFTALGILAIGVVFEAAIARLAHFDLWLITLTVLTAIVATLIAAFYPAWRAAQVQPAWQLKSN
ncbi:ABC transporter permease [Rhodanobacter sp. L36]|uniref:ABC transporter permease n=1 Tax=Rhodanobacter sp. L36 TaxID=1747221 RepID=UPI00131C74DF|nr:ABC transporter permease [Rhodanobacter sp. L36]